MTDVFCHSMFHNPLVFKLIFELGRHLHTGCEEPYFHWNYGRSTLKVLYFPQKYVGEYFVYTTSLFYFIYA
jgi:hypothetical protein